MQNYYLGADIGGTKTLVYIANAEGEIIGVGRAGSGNHETVGFDEQLSVLSNAFEHAFHSAGIQKEQITAAGFGIAGYDWSMEREAIFRNIYTLLGDHVPFDVVNDALVGLVSGSEAGWGIGVVSGTGCNCWGWDQTRTKIGRVTGAGLFMGEGAGASEIVQRAVKEIAYEWSMRGPKTALSAAFMKWTGAHSLEQLLEGLIRDQFELDASAAPLVFQVAAEGDPVANGIIHWAGLELAEMVKCVTRQLNFEQLAFDVVTIGSVINSYPHLIEIMAAEIKLLAPQARIIKPQSTPAAGGVMLAISKMLGELPLAMRKTIIDSANAIEGSSQCTMSF